MRIIKAILSIIIGIILISFIVEFLDVLIYIVISGKLPNPDNPEEFLSIRNHLLFLIGKVIYTSLAYFIAGLIVYKINEYNEFAISGALGVIQIIFLILGVINNGETAPMWFWITIIVLCLPLIVLGSYYSDFRTKSEQI